MNHKRVERIWTREGLKIPKNRGAGTVLDEYTSGTPWENGYIESFNSKLRDELLNREVFTTLFEASILIEE